MMQKIYTPDIGSEPMVVTEILVEAGDRVEQEQPLVVVEAGKVSMEIPSPCAGVVAQIITCTGKSIRTHDVLMHFSDEAEDLCAVTSTGDDSQTCHVDRVESTQQNIVEAQGITIDTPCATVEHLDHESHQEIHASPMVRRVAREWGIDLTQVPAHGPKGRILGEDLQRYVKETLAAATEKATVQQAALDVLPWPRIKDHLDEQTETVVLNRIRRLTGAHLHRNWVMIPHVTQWEYADVTELEAFRKQQNVKADPMQGGAKLTLLVFILQAVAHALRLFPRFNSMLSADGQQLHLKHHIHIGIATDTPDGLVVPVIRDVFHKGAATLARELAELVQSARTGRLTAKEMQGGCFTLSNLGGIVNGPFTPIINAPEVAILGVSRATVQPHWDGERFVPRLLLPLSLSYDHRVIDGAEGARFISYLSRLLADIRHLVL